MYAICIYCSRVVLLFINVYNFALTTPNNIPVFQNVAAFYLSIFYLVVFVLYPVEEYCVTFDILGEGVYKEGLYIYFNIQVRNGDHSVLPGRSSTARRPTSCENFT